MPSLPGVYWFLDRNNQVIYVGKAKNLKSRLKSYSLNSGLLPKTKTLIAHTQSVKYQVLNSELEALLVEAELIRIHQPHYNILLKDDKSPLYIVTTKDPFPQVLSLRKSDLNVKNTRFRRIFGPFPSGWQVCQVLKIARRLFPYCNASETDKKRHRACFYSHLGLCPGACLGIVGTTEYTQNIRQLELFLAGHHRRIIRSLTKQVNLSSSIKDYETAGMLKSKIESIQYIISHYKNRIADQILPNLNDDIYQQREIELIRLLNSQNVKINHVNRIEAYDVSNLQGKSATVSMVVAINGKLDHSEYRHFSVQSLDTPNDPKMLQEIIVRRQHHPDWGIPEIIMLDGGMAQIRAVAGILEWPCVLLGLAKQPDRLLIAVSKNPLSVSSLRLDPSHPAAGLLISLRDESHRFARRLHHHQSTKKLLNQKL